VNPGLSKGAFYFPSLHLRILQESVDIAMTTHKLILTAAAVALSTLVARAADPQIVAITQIVEHPALNDVRDGVVEELARQGFKDKEQIQVLFENAQGQPSIASQIARQFVGKNPAVIVTIATPSSQAVISVTDTIPVIFSAVTDPVDAKLVKSLKADPDNKNVTGVSDKLPVDAQIGLIKNFLPDVKKVGIVYSPSEPNSVIAVQEFKEAGTKLGIEVVEAPAMKSADVQSAARSLIGKVDAMYTPTDNTVVATLESVVSVSYSSKIPFFAADTNSVERGALAAIGYSYKQLGIETGKLVARVLKGEKPADIPTVFSESVELFVNKTAAAKSGLRLSDEVLKSAVKVIE
jgi:putative ABC transport system substrate-binding protein